jgi:hypothetical protein
MATKAKPDTLAGAMSAAFAEIEAATKGANNPHFKSKYADLGAVIDAVKPALIAHDLFFTQHCHPAEDGVMVETVLGHASGEEKSLGKLFVPANKRDAQGFGSALTYARRYGLMTAFGVPAEDDDGNAASRSTNGAANINGPAPREKLDGPHTSKTALKAAVEMIRAEVRKAETNETIDALLETHKRTINQARRDWPALIDGFPDIPEDGGLRGTIAQQREVVAEDGVVTGMIRSMRECDTKKALENWMIANEAAVEALDGAESRRFQLAYELRESNINEMDRASA